MAHFVAKAYKATKKGRRTIGDKDYFYKSAWEANVARILEKMKQAGEIKEWLYEDKIFWFETIRRGVRSYVPDFKVIGFDDTHEWWEVKGYWDARSLTKMKRMAKYYPKEKMVIVDSKKYKSLMNEYKAKIGSAWE